MAEFIHKFYHGILLLEVLNCRNVEIMDVFVCILLSALSIQHKSGLNVDNEIGLKEGF
jgi:hypothetical protein